MQMLSRPHREGENKNSVSYEAANQAANAMVPNQVADGDDLPF